MRALLLQSFPLILLTFVVLVFIPEPGVEFSSFRVFVYPVSISQCLKPVLFPPFRSDFDLLMFHRFLRLAEHFEFCHWDISGRC